MRFNHRPDVARKLTSSTHSANRCSTASPPAWSAYLPLLRLRTPSGHLRLCTNRIRKDSFIRRAHRRGELVVWFSAFIRLILFGRQTLAPRIVTRLRALILLPTRDLVAQVRETFQSFGKGTGLKVRCPSSKPARALD